MRILDENDNEIAESDVETSIGEIFNDRIVIGQTAAIPAVQEKSHFEVRNWYFTDGTHRTVNSNNDPTVKVIDENVGLFEYVDDGSGKKYSGADVIEVIDQQASPAVPAKTEYEDIKRYRKYSDSELAAIDKEKKREKFLTNGPTQIEDLTILLSELVGVNTEEV